MQGKRNKFKPDFKAKVALEALKGDKSTADLAQIYSVHPSQITAWKKQLLEDAPSVFEGKRPSRSTEVDIDEASGQRAAERSGCRVSRTVPLIHRTFDDFVGSSSCWST